MNICPASDPVSFSLATSTTEPVFLFVCGFSSLLSLCWLIPAVAVAVAAAARMNSFPLPDLSGSLSVAVTVVLDVGCIKLALSVSFEVDTGTRTGEGGSGILRGDFVGDERIVVAIDVFVGRSVRRPGFRGDEARDIFSPTARCLIESVYCVVHNLEGLRCLCSIIAL